MGSNKDTNLLFPTDNLYIDWAFVNDGNLNVNTAFTVDLYVDNTKKGTWQISSLPSGYFDFSQDYGIGQLSAGNHAITLRIDSTNVIVESNKTDNAYTRIVTINPSTSCAFSLVTPVNPLTYLSGSGASSIQQAYDISQDGNILFVQALGTQEHLNFSRNASFRLLGGTNCDHSAYVGYTTLNGSLTISGGNVEISDFIIQ